MARINYKKAKELGLISGKRSKYNNDVVTYEGEKFDSRKELLYWLNLRDREKCGEIENLKRQVSITIQPSFKVEINGKAKTIRAITYIADFVYYDLRDHKKHYIDVKGFKTEVYKLKYKLLAYNNIIIEEV